MNTKVASIQRLIQQLTPLIVIAMLIYGCKVELNERTVQCSERSPVDKAHAWGSTIALTPKPGREWSALLRKRFQIYGKRPVNAQGLRDKFGTPARSESVNGLDFFEYETPDGQLHLAQAEEKSGSAVHRTWRLTLFLSTALRPSEIIESNALKCAQPLLRPQANLVVLSADDGTPRVNLKISKGNTREVEWLNLKSP